MRDFRTFFFKVGDGHCSYIEFTNEKNAIVDLYVNEGEETDNQIMGIEKNITYQMVESVGELGEK